MKIMNFKSISNGIVVCSFDLQFTNLGLTIREYKLLESNGTRWLAPPSRPYQDESGKKKFFNYIFLEKENKDRFDKAVIQLLEPFLQQPVAKPASFDFDQQVPW